MLSEKTISVILKVSSYSFLLIEVYLFWENVYWALKERDQENILLVEDETGAETLYAAIIAKDSESDSSEEDICKQKPLQSLADFAVNVYPPRAPPADVLQRKLHNALWNTALFFPDYLPKAENSTTKKLIWYLSQAKTSIKFCIFSVQFPQLEKALQDIKKSGVDVKGVVHSPASGRRLKQRGITTKIWKQRHLSPYDITGKTYIDLMHHKFLILDDKYLINGSLNWTYDGVTRNRENVLITNNERSVKSFLQEFEKIWLVSDIGIPAETWRDALAVFK